MATMDIMRSSLIFRVAELKQLLFLSKRVIFSPSILCCIMTSQVAFAETSITPTFRISEVFVDNEFDTFSENGNVTRISPGLIINSNGAKSDFSMVYAYDVIRSNDLEQEDRETNELALSAEFRHKPNQWASYVRANNRLVNRDIDGVQSSNPEFFDDNSEELFTSVAGTNYSERLTRNIQYSAGLGVDYADEEDGDRSSGQEVSLAIDNFVSDNFLTWRAQIQSNVDNNESDDDDERIDELEIIFNYRFDQTLSSFLELTKTETDVSDQDVDSAIIGLRWSPTRQTFVSVGIGKISDDDTDDETYDLDARITRAHSLFSASYSESITSDRDQLFELQDDQFGQSTNQSTSITTVRRKRTDIAWTLTGVRSSITLSIFRDEESNPDIVDKQETTGGNIGYSRQLSPRSSLSLSAFYEENEFTEKSTLDEYRVSYQKSTSETAAFDIFVSYASFDSTNDSIDYDQSLAGVTYRVTF